MTQVQWQELTLFEQLSNIAGEVKRCIDTRKSYLAGDSSKDYSEFYWNKAAELVNRTIQDAKNQNRGKELLDELTELRRYLNGEVDSDYILRYWEPYTTALAQTR